MLHFKYSPYYLANFSSLSQQINDFQTFYNKSKGVICNSEIESDKPFISLSSVSFPMFSQKQIQQWTSNSTITLEELKEADFEHFDHIDNFHELDLYTVDDYE